AGLGGDGVDGDAAGERVRRDRGVGHGIGLVEGSFGPELGGDRVDEGDELGGIGDGVDALGGQRGVGGNAAEVDAEDIHRLVPADHAHARGLADDAAAGCELGGGDRLDEVDGAHAPDFLVIGEGEVDGFAQLRSCQLLEAGGDDADEGFHVRAGTAVVPAVADFGGGWMRLPVLSVDGDDIGVAGQHDSAGGGAVGGRDGGEQVRFGALGVRDAAGFDAGGLEAGFDVLDKWEVRIPARGVEGDEVGDLGESGLCGLS